MKIFTGVGSRMRTGKKTLPIDIFSLMKKLSIMLNSKDWKLRTGNAEGADEAFRLGSYSYRGKNNKNEIEVYWPNDIDRLENGHQAMELAAKFHPVWNKMSDFAKKLHGRNAYQVLGKDLNNPSDCLICWTPDGCKRHKDRSIATGGTGTAISIADHYDVRIFNLGDEKDRIAIEKWIGNMEKDVNFPNCLEGRHEWTNEYDVHEYVKTTCLHCGECLERKYPL